ncbi:MAG TPA: MYXO-CTERM sorting domain-containing protein, partial [Polyangiaceae bacterium]
TTTATSGAAPDASTDDSGCNCRTVTHGSAPRSLWGIALLGLLTLLQRRRRNGAASAQSVNP